MVDDTGVRQLRTLFVDTDGRLGPAADALSTLAEPVSVRRVDSLSAAVEAVDGDSFDCVVLLDAPVVDGHPAVDGVEQYREAREVLPSVPIVLYSLDCDHERLERIIEVGVPVVSAPPERPDLIYRRLRHAAGMEQHFQSDRDLLQSLLEYYPHHIFLKDDAGRFEAVSEATAREYGFTRHELVGLTDYEMLDPSTARETYEEEQALLESGEATNRIDHWIDEAGRHRWMSITKAPRYDEAGDPVGIVGSSRDVTEEKRREQMVREVHEASRELVRAERKRDISEAAMSLAEDIPVFSVIQVVLTDPQTGDLEPVADGDASLFERYEAQFAAVIDDNEARYVTTDGAALTAPDEPTPLEAVLLPLPGHGALGLSADAETFTDFGLDLANILASNLEAALDRAERERELARQNERLEEFASIVSHDLRNPLNVASAATELLAEETDSENVDRVRNALERMDGLIDALLTLARKGKIVGETEFVSVAAAARDAWEVVDAPRATLTIDGDGYVAADPGRLTELFENLFRNAVEHGSTSPPSQAQGDSEGRSPSGSQAGPDDAVEHGGTDISIRVGVRSDGDGFFVADDGVGIAADASDQLFEMGYSTNSSGTGYGLYIVSTIAEAHGWEVSAGDSDGGGARFDVHGTTVTPEQDLAR